MKMYIYIYIFTMCYVQCSATLSWPANAHHEDVATNMILRPMHFDCFGCGVQC